MQFQFLNIYLFILHHYHSYHPSPVFSHFLPHPCSVPNANPLNFHFCLGKGKTSHEYQQNKAYQVAVRFGKATHYE